MEQVCSIIRGGAVLITDHIQLGELVRRRRRKLNLSQSELAEKVGATRQWVSRLEKGKHDISTARLFAVLDALEMNLEIRPPAANATISVPFPDVTSIVPAAALNAIRGMPMPQFSIPNLSGLMAVQYPTLPDNVAQALKALAFSGATPPSWMPPEERAAAATAVQPAEGELSNTDREASDEHQRDKSE